jgi:hypothetical protein
VNKKVCKKVVLKQLKVNKKKCYFIYMRRAIDERLGREGFRETKKDARDTCFFT